MEFVIKASIKERFNIDEDTPLGDLIYFMKEYKLGLMDVFRRADKKNRKNTYVKVKDRTQEEK